jgi:uncharacterized OsmC-like protein
MKCKIAATRGCSDSRRIETRWDERESEFRSKIRIKIKIRIKGRSNTEG